MKRRILLILAVLGLFFLIIAGMFLYARRRSPAKIQARIELAMQAQKLDRAQELALLYVSRYPDDWRGYYLQAKVKNRLGRYNEAREILLDLRDRAEILKPDPDMLPPEVFQNKVIIYPVEVN